MKISFFRFYSGETDFQFQLCPSMERYQQPMVNIMTRRASPQHVPASSSSLLPTTLPPTAATTLMCPAGTPQNPIYLTIPFTAPSEEHISEVASKRPKEQEASMFIACSDHRLIIGMKDNTALYQMRTGVVNGGLTSCVSPLLGGDGGHALCLQQDLEEGFTEVCETFKSKPLCRRNFRIQALEVWGIQNSISLYPGLQQQ